MERMLDVRRPPEQSQTGLSRASKIFFGCDIFQVIAVVVFQSSMIALGDFSAYNNTEHPGMGPGRRIYMVIYMGAVFYTCLLCLFAVKWQNFMEIIAFDLQNFGFLTYSFVQLYHVRFKKYNGLRTSESDALPKIVIANAMTLLILNIVFTYLSYKLYMEFGWKIYKRVRFNIRLRGIYQLYELLSCLLKMEILYWGMFAIVHSFVLLRDSHNILYFMSLSFIPLTLMYAALGYYAAQRENRVLMIFFLAWTLAGIGYFLYKLYGFITRTCNGCAEFEVTGKDIPSEAFMHFIYLGIMNLVVAIIIFGVAVKVYRNFGGGLAQHFRQKKKPQEQSSARLNLGRGSHCYPEESVISVTSYDSAFDEFGESVRLDRGMLHPVHTELPLLSENGHLRVDKRSCSLPNLLSDSSARPASYPGPSDGDVSLLSGWLQAEEGKRDSANLEIISEEATPENPETCDSGAKLAPDEMSLKVDETTQGSGFNAFTDNVHISNNGDVSFPNFHVHGCVHSANETLACTDMDLLPKHRQNGHHPGKTRLKHTGAGFENGCGLRAVNSGDGNDEQTSSQGSLGDLSSRKPLDVTQRTAHFAQGIV